MFKKSLALTSLTLLLAASAIQINDASASTKPSQSLRSAPKLLRGYWETRYGLEAFKGNRVIYITKGFQPYEYKTKWSKGDVAHTFLYKQEIATLPIYIFQASHNKFHSIIATHQGAGVTFHRISHAKFKHLCKTWAKNRA
ncbi:hypothetical protein [Levilactobacillus acidifarinae]|uniref:Uncharacterized protein n=1 Tax=Levilactobacillus acidifarinae DSM 19394 = JCM 15949 TaxID=1423715 RepID=A0A0R1LP65_9LACO|nr:hypothetical protein [Levilactobacillus acidifarinae]KRK94505.1 hypothetical protein FD25_GL000470 [Levilactobacillus acidifarinae DSM 19394]GEO68249.1 hypothetical protein LAC03_01590 [Levilactobacillus acidifarinae]